MPSAATAAVQGVERKLRGFARLQELSKSTEQRLTALNALAEHVSHKTKALETQKLAVERAVVEATRLNEMVWNMDAQIAKLARAASRCAQPRRPSVRMETLARPRRSSWPLATAGRDEFVREVARSRPGQVAVGAMEPTLERLSIEKEESTPSTSACRRSPRRWATPRPRAGRDGQAGQGLVSWSEGRNPQQGIRRPDRQGRRAGAQPERRLEALGRSSRRSTRSASAPPLKHENLLQAQKDLEAVRSELTEFHQAHAEAAQLRDKLALDRAALDAFGERTAAMLGRTPELQDRLDGCWARWHWSSGPPRRPRAWTN